MTGTAKTEEEEFRKIYSMDVVVIPTNRPAQQDHSDIIFKTEETKFRGIARRSCTPMRAQQPVLVGTRSIETSERLSERVAIGAAADSRDDPDAPREAVQHEGAGKEKERSTTRS